MARKLSKSQQLVDLARHIGVLHARDLKPLGIHREYLQRLCSKGILKKIGRGIYILPEAVKTRHLGLVQASKAVPKGIICLLSALNFHEIGTQLPHEVWITLDSRSAKPSIAHPKLRIIRSSGKALTSGIKEYEINEAKVKIYNPAKTVVDCFKYRNKIGLDVALEALREVRRMRICANDEIWKYAKVCRMTKVMRPYMEAMQY